MNKFIYWAKIWSTTLIVSSLLISLILNLTNFQLNEFLQLFVIILFYSLIFSSPTFIVLGLILSINSKKINQLRMILSLISLIGIIISFQWIGLNIFEEGITGDGFMIYVFAIVMIGSIYFYRLTFDRTIQLIIFDLDGTLLNTYEDLGNAVNYILVKHDYPTHPIDSYKTFIGKGIDNLLQTCLPKDFEDELKFSQIRNEFVQYYELHKNDQTHIYAGIIDLLNELKSMNIKLAIASNKYHSATVELAQQYFPPNTFNVIFGNRENVAKKPNPQIILDIINLTQTSQDKVIFVGDSGVDMQTARNANVKSVGVTWGFRSEKELIDHGANYIIHHPKELNKLLA